MLLPMGDASRYRSLLLAVNDWCTGNNDLLGLIPQSVATKDAGCIAAIEVLRIISEPSAASMTYRGYGCGGLEIYFWGFWIDAFEDNW